MTCFLTPTLDPFFGGGLWEGRGEGGGGGGGGSVFEVAGGRLGSQQEGAT